MTTVSDRLWAQIEPIAYITREQFDRGLAEWKIEEVECSGHLAFVTLVRGAEFHLASFGTKAPITLSMVRSHLSAVLARNGYVTTRTPIEGADRQHRFNRRFGFRETGRDEFFVHYRMEALCL